MDILRKIKEKRQPILILDEVQTLQDIYMNGEIKKKHLLTEFFNFLVRLTKETHLAHVVVMTSETLFVEKLYNHSRLAETSDFYLIGHLDFKQVQEWLKYEGIGDKEIVNLIWEYVGGSAHRINDAIRIVKKGDSLEHYLLDEAKIYRGKISHFIAKSLKNTEARKKFRIILKQLVQDGFVIRNNDDDLETEVLDLAIEYEFLFLNPREEKIVFNSRIVRKGAELLVEG
jgi:AAA+ ATPase superfamily predicted ATPase